MYACLLLYPQHLCLRVHVCILLLNRSAILIHSLHGFRSSAFCKCTSLGCDDALFDFGIEVQCVGVKMSRGGWAGGGLLAGGIHVSKKKRHFF